MITSEIDSKIIALAQSIEELAGDVQDEASRKKLLGVVEKAQRKLESPMDVIWKLIMSVGVLKMNMSYDSLISLIATCTIGNHGTDKNGCCYKASPGWKAADS
jgi:hypothetical protein